MRTVLLTVCIIMGHHGIGQSNLEKAQQHLKDLKQSFLLVRLQTNDLKIKALEDRGLEREAEKVRQEQYRENKETIMSFKNTFTFCPVYFFYSNNSDEIRAEKLEGNVFDHDLKTVSASTLLSARPFYTAKFAETDNLGISALMIMDQFLVPLESPFPYFERKYVFFSLIKISQARMAEKLNARLHAQYDEWFKAPEN